MNSIEGKTNILSLSENNLAARSVNSHLTPKQNLRQLNNVVTNQAIPNFPNAEVNIDTMNGPTLVAVLRELGIAVNGTMSVADRKKVLKTAIGISEIKRD